MRGRSRERELKIRRALRPLGVQLPLPAPATRSAGHEARSLDFARDFASGLPLVPQSGTRSRPLNGSSSTPPPGTREPEQRGINGEGVKPGP